jgi:hypothetical protein
MINPKEPTKESTPRPSRERLTQTAEEVWKYSDDVSHDLEKGSVTDKLVSVAEEGVTARFVPQTILLIE